MSITRSHELELTIAPRRRELHAVRAAVGTWLAERGVEPIRREGVVLVVSELVTNAIEASPPDAPVTIAISEDDGMVDLEVTDHGAGFSVSGHPFPDAHEARGRGLAIVHALTSNLFVHCDGLTRVHAQWAAAPI